MCFNRCTWTADKRNTYFLKFRFKIMQKSDTKVSVQLVAMGFVIETVQGIEHIWRLRNRD